MPGKCAGVVECSLYILQSNRSSNSKWQLLSCAARAVPITVRDDARKGLLALTVRF